MAKLVVVLVACLALTACSHSESRPRARTGAPSNRYSAERTWRCLASKNYLVRLESGPEMAKGVESDVSVERLATRRREAVQSGGFSFLAKDADARAVRQGFLDNRKRMEKRIIGGPPGVPWIEIDTPKRNVVPWWSATDPKFKADVQRCLS